MPANSRKISLAKTLSWRVLATFTTFCIAWAVTGDITAGLAVGGIEAVAKMFLYYVHERAWERFLHWRAVLVPTDGAGTAPRSS